MNSTNSTNLTAGGRPFLLGLFGVFSSPYWASRLREMDDLRWPTMSLRDFLAGAWSRSRFSGTAVAQASFGGRRRQALPQEGGPG